jgi:hypothetical protein
MAKLPPIDTQAHWIRDLLHRGRRNEALARINRAIAQGSAGRETLELAEYLASAKRGRQPFGSKHLWPDIGIENDEMREAGMSREERLRALSIKYRMGDPAKVATAIATYEKAISFSLEDRDDLKQL